MNDLKECPLCCEEGEGRIDAGGICDSCMDVMEFGYRSFPAYKLQEATRVKDIKEAKTC